MTPWLLNLVRFCKHNDDAKRQRVTAILDKLITMTINEKQMYPSIQAKIWGSLGQVSERDLGALTREPVSLCNAVLPFPIILNQAIYQYARV